jgi:hypothetical protein
MHIRVRRPLSFVSAGVALVALDFRTDLPDLLPDPVGWALVAVGAWALALRPAALLAAVAVLLSLSDAALPYRYVYIDPGTGQVVNDRTGELRDFPVAQRWPDVSDARALAIGAAVAAGGLALWLVVRAVAERSARTGNGSAARWLRVFALAVPVVWAAPTLALVGVGVGGDDGYDPVWDGNLEYAGLAGTLVLAGLAVRLVLDRDQPWARPPRSLGPSLRRLGRGEQTAGAPPTPVSPAQAGGLQPD